MEEAFPRNHTQTSKIEGKWRYTDHTLVRQPCLQVKQEALGTKPSDLCIQSVEVYGTGQVEIGIEPDRGVAYRK